jgi:hypothetical protein
LCMYWACHVSCAQTAASSATASCCIHICTQHAHIGIHIHHACIHLSINTHMRIYTCVCIHQHADSKGIHSSSPALTLGSASDQARGSCAKCKQVLQRVSSPSFSLAGNVFPCMFQSLADSPSLSLRPTRALSVQPVFTWQPRSKGPDNRCVRE